MVSRTRLRLSAAGVLVFVLACGDGTGPTSGPAARLQPVAGDSQTGPVGSRLPTALRVRVTDASGTPVYLAPVRFVAQPLSGWTTPQVTETDARGEAVVTWTLGAYAAAQHVRVSILDGPTEAVFEFTATGVPGPPVSMVRVVGLVQAGYPSQPLNSPLVAAAIDRFGNPVPDVPIRWRVVTGGGTLSASETRTATNGLTSVVWTLGPFVTNVFDTVYASADGLTGSPAPYVALVVPPPPNAAVRRGR